MKVELQLKVISFVLREIKKKKESFMHFLHTNHLING